MFRNASAIHAAISIGFDNTGHYQGSRLESGLPMYDSLGLQ